MTTDTNNIAYHAEDFVASLPAEEYIARFRDAERFAGCCRQCSGYNRSWGCPPFGFDVEERLRSYARIMIVAARITPAESGLPVSAAQQLIRPERIRLEGRLLELEGRFGGLACAYVGSCLHCGELSCTRPVGKPCRHPELVRPSLEAYGFDIGKTLSELFGIELKWGTEGRMPEYLTLVCGFFHGEGVDIRW